MLGRPVRFRVALLVAALLVSPALVAPLLAAPTRHALRSVTSPTHTPGEVMVVLPDGASFARGARGEALVPDAARAALFAQLGLVPVRASGTAGGGAGAFGGRIALLRSPRPDFDPVAASATLRGSGLFRAACPNYQMRLHATLPNDPYVPDQWYVRDPGGADIHLPEAWDVAKGDASVVIAILDTGVDTGHPDLASKIWTNPGEIAGNGLDDDADGFVDDVHGWDFGDGDNDPNPAPMFDEIGLDEGFHGTFCAGIASAATHNAVGIAGAGWNCRILPLRIFDSTGNATTSAITDAFAFAIDHGVKVISMSFGAPDQPGLGDFFQALVDAADSAGIVCVASAGNDSTDTPLEFPAACARVIAVAATDQSNARAEFSNFGGWVDVAAPGASMWSTICENYVIDDLSQLFYLFFFGWDGENPYMFGDGTSFACPLVAGVCGLMRAAHPTLTPAQVAAQLVATGDVVAYDHPIGPKVNAFRAVTAGVLAVDRPAVSGRAGLLASPNPAPGAVRLVGDLGETSESFTLAIYDCAGRRVRVVASGAIAAGPHGWTWDGRDEAGRACPAGLYFARLAGASRAATVRVVRLER